MITMENSEDTPNAADDGTLPRPFQQPSGRQLLGPVSSHFEAFYRSTLRYCSGGRLRTTHVATWYSRWAAENAAPSMSLRQLKRAMTNVGHTHVKSNGMHFGDVQRAADAPHLPDNFPDGAPLPGRRRRIVARIDRIGIELERLRRDVQAPSRSINNF